MKVVSDHLYERCLQFVEKKTNHVAVRGSVRTDSTFFVLQAMLRRLYPIKAAGQMETFQKAECTFQKHKLYEYKVRPYLLPSRLAIQRTAHNPMSVANPKFLG